MGQISTPNPLADLTRVEDYLEVVYDLIEAKGYARVSDIAERLDVKLPSVTSMIKKLDGMGLVVYERYRGLTLTDKGKQMARFSREKHSTITKLLKVLGVGEKIAELDAEGMEHHLHRETINRLELFVDFVGKNQSWFKRFEDVK